MISVIVPTGDYPFFVNACSKNIRENTGLDTCFITAKNPSKMLVDSICNANCRYLEAPFPYDERGIHLKLLDWAICQEELEDLIYVQHCDMFWEKPWLHDVIGLGGVAICFSHDKLKSEFKPSRYKFFLDNKPLLRTHDFAGVYNRKFLLDNRLSFIWGIVENLGSEKLLDAVDNKRILRLNGSFLTRQDYLDGSDRIGLELALIGDGLVKESKTSSFYYHCWDLFGMGFDSCREDDKIIVNRQFNKSTRGLLAYSWISSYLFDKQEMGNKLFPWCFVKENIENLKMPIICEFIKKYKNNDCFIGMDDNGISKILFKDVIWSKKYVS